MLHTRPASSSSSSSPLLRALLRALAPALVLAAGGCLGGPYCTAEAVSSLAVTVQLADGTAVDDATVTAELEGEEPQACTSTGEGAYDCGFYEQAGAFTVVATKTGFAMASDSVVVGEGQCHVGTQEVALELLPE